MQIVCNPKIICIPMKNEKSLKNGLSMGFLRYKKREVLVYFLLWLWVTYFLLALLPTSLYKHKYERIEASTPSLKTVHRTVFLTVTFKSCHRFAGIIKIDNTNVLSIFMSYDVTLDTRKTFARLAFSLNSFAWYTKNVYTNYVRRACTVYLYAPVFFSLYLKWNFAPILDKNLTALPCGCK